MICPPPSAPPGLTVDRDGVIKGSPMGETLREYYGGKDHSSLYNTMNHFFKMQVGHVLEWDTSGWGMSYTGKLTVLKVGKTYSDEKCFQYKSELQVTSYKQSVLEILAHEDYVGVACTSALLDKIRTLNLYLETPEDEVESSRRTK